MMKVQNGPNPLEYVQSVLGVAESGDYSHRKPDIEIDKGEQEFSDAEIYALLLAALPANLPRREPGLNMEKIMQVRAPEYYIGARLATTSKARVIIDVPEGSAGETRLKRKVELLTNRLGARLSESVEFVRSSKSARELAKQSGPSTLVLSRHMRWDTNEATNAVLRVIAVDQEKLSAKQNKELEARIAAFGFITDYLKAETPEAKQAILKMIASRPVLRAILSQIQLPEPTQFTLVKTSQGLEINTGNTTIRLSQISSNFKNALQSSSQKTLMNGMQGSAAILAAVLQLNIPDESAKNELEIALEQELDKVAAYYEAARKAPKLALKKILLSPTTNLNMTGTIFVTETIAREKGPEATAELLGENTELQFRLKTLRQTQNVKLNLNLALVVVDARLADMDHNAAIAEYTSQKQNNDMARFGNNILFVSDKGQINNLQAHIKKSHLSGLFSDRIILVSGENEKIQLAKADEAQGELSFSMRIANEAKSLYGTVHVSAGILISAGKVEINVAGLTRLIDGIYRYLPLLTPLQLLEAFEQTVRATGSAA